jgi:hypothetical protein
VVGLRAALKVMQAADVEQAKPLDVPGGSKRFTFSSATVNVGWKIHLLHRPKGQGKHRWSADSPGGQHYELLPDACFKSGLDVAWATFYVNLPQHLVDAYRLDHAKFIQEVYVPEPV